MKITILIGLIISTLNLYSQIQIQENRDCDTSLFTTLEQNQDWIDNILNVDFEKQLNILRERILLDTNICVSSYYSDRINIIIHRRDKNESKGEGKPLLVFDGYPLFISELNSYNNVEFISSLINTENIDNLSIGSGDTATALMEQKLSLEFFY